MASPMTLRSRETTLSIQSDTVYPNGSERIPETGEDSNDMISESSPLLSYSPEDTFYALTNWQLAGLYTTHSLSMWNSRSYEFGSTLFVLSAYPSDLTVASLRGLSTNLASVVFSSAVGRWCNRHPSRLRTLQISIILQRICIVIACLVWPLIVQVPQGRPSKPVPDHTTHANSWLKAIILIMLIILGMIEKLSALANLIVMERDWVPLLASPTSNPPLHILNATMKRIDLITKLGAPLIISGIAVYSNNLRITAFVIAGTQVLSAGPEIYTAHKVWTSNLNLHTPRFRHGTVPNIPSSSSAHLSYRQWIKTWSSSLRLFASSPACVPALCSAVQPFTVLTLSASMTMYLLATNFPLSTIAAARTLSTVVELGSTIVAPWLISLLTARYAAEPGSSYKPLFRVGNWGLVWQISFLIPAVGFLLLLPSNSSDPAREMPAVTILLFTFMAVSRLGPFGYGLVEQQLVQTIVPSQHRVEFSGVEFALTSFAELSRWGLTAIFGTPAHFKRVASANLVLLAASCLVFRAWTKKWWNRTENLKLEIS